MGKKDTYIVGITGGTGTGKSLVTVFFKQFGANVLDVDIMAKEVMSNSSKIKKELISNYGKRVISPEKKLNYDVIRGIVFNDKNELKKLNSIVWPEMLKELETRIREFRENNMGMFVVDMAVLFEAKAQKLFDVIILVKAPKETRINRLIENRKWTRDLAEKIIEFQSEEKPKEAFWDFIINNNKSIEHLKNETEKIFTRIQNKFSN
ncbi:dephospho-CoA kinase [candidate division KSB1 bacterium]|nr:MAG: dephospho-CoA kinase [candidate division KSB1 bacterium]